MRICFVTQGAQPSALSISLEEWDGVEDGKEVQEEGVKYLVANEFMLMCKKITCYQEPNILQ